MARTYNDIYYNDDENSTAEILDDMKKLAESVDQQIGSIKSFNNDTSQFIEQVTPLMNNLSEQVIDMHQLADTMFTELEQVKEENKQLREDLNGLPKGQASGESIDLNDSAEMRCELKISGNSEQETRSGKNYLNMFTKYKAGDTPTINGIKFTFNKDGSITCDGTASADTTLEFSIPDGGQKINGTDKKLVGLIGGEYSYTKAISFVVYDENWGNTKYISLVSANKNSTQVMADNIEYSRFRIIVYKDTVINNRTLYLQVLDALQEDLSYEPYGASPSPDYPSEVECCGDNINIFDGEVEEGNIDASTGQNTAVTNAWRSKNYLNVKDTSVSISVKDLTFSGTVGRLYFYKSDNTYISNILINSLPFTATLPNETAKVRFFILNSVADINAKIKLEKGSTVTPYSPYGQGCINEVICNKNLAIKNVKGYFSISDFKIKIDNNSESFLFYAEKGKEYTRSCKVNLDRNRIGKIDTLDVTQGMTVLNGQEINSKKFICDDSGIYIWFVNSTLNDSIKESFQIEESSTESTFVQHEEQSYIIPIQQSFKSIGDTRDKFIKKNNKWYERHNIARLVLKGNGFWSYNAGVGFHSSSLQGIVKNGSEALSNKYKYTPLTWQGNYTFSINSTGLIAISDNTYSTVDDWKAHLAEQYANGTPVYVDYLLAEPLDIECTEEQSTILDQIENEAKTYKNVTHIYSTDEISPVIDVTYKKDIETLFANTLVEGV